MEGSPTILRRVKSDTSELWINAENASNTAKEVTNLNNLFKSYDYSKYLCLPIAGLYTCNYISLTFVENSPLAFYVNLISRLI